MRWANDVKNAFFTNERVRNACVLRVGHRRLIRALGLCALQSVSSRKGGEGAQIPPSAAAQAALHVKAEELQREKST